MFAAIGLPDLEQLWKRWLVTVGNVSHLQSYQTGFTSGGGIGGDPDPRDSGETERSHNISSYSVSHTHTHTLTIFWQKSSERSERMSHLSQTFGGSYISNIPPTDEEQSGVTLTCFYE